jgi:pyruvate,orthophosphate dikinase
MRAGLPVPPGFTITTEVCTEFTENNNTYPPSLKDEVDVNIRKVEVLGKKFGSLIILSSFGSFRGPLPCPG